MKINILILPLLIASIIFLGCIETQEENTFYEENGTLNTSFSIVDIPVKYASVNGIDIGYREIGSGEPLVMIMYFSGTMDMYNDTFISKLADGHRVIIFDNRGMGYSTDNEDNFSLSLFASDTAGLMDTLELSSANIFGSSMGASIAQELTLEYPDKVDRLILSSSAYSLDISQTDVLRSKLQNISLNPRSDPVLSKYAAANLEWNGTYDRLPGINSKVLLLVGNDDMLTPADISVEMAEQIPDAQLILFDSVGHCGEQYLPKEYADAIIDFLSVNTNENAELIKG
jgi:pimeloyl-ACP methyl ester carboxylesterase